MPGPRGARLPSFRRGGRADRRSRGRDGRVDRVARGGCRAIRGGHYLERTSLAPGMGGERTFTTGATATRWPTKAEVASAATIFDWTGSNEAVCSSACGYVATIASGPAIQLEPRRYRTESADRVPQRTGSARSCEETTTECAEATSDQRRAATGVWRWRREGSILPARRVRAAAVEAAVAAAAAAAAAAAGEAGATAIRAAARRLRARAMPTRRCRSRTRSLRLRRSTRSLRRCPRRNARSPPSARASKLPPPRKPRGRRPRDSPPRRAASPPRRRRSGRASWSRRSGVARRRRARGASRCARRTRTRRVARLRRARRCESWTAASRRTRL